MTYDPNNDGRPDRFNLISLEVHSGKLNVGVKYADGQIAVYNNLTAGFRWFLIDANNLTRATFERPARFTENFIVDNVAFEATTGAGLPAAALAPTDDVIEGETEHEPLAQVFPDSSIFEPPDVCGALVATIVGTPGPDVINGTSGPDVILGLGGNDKIRGLGGNDTICGNGGADELYGRGGTDFIFGGEGIDLLHGGVGNDRLSGDDGDDAVYGDDGADSLFGNLGDDLLHAGPGDDRLDGGPDTDKCNGGLDTDTASNCEILFFIP
jgi:Ca2+-binding RTX toxin-like protein